MPMMQHTVGSGQDFNKSANRTKLSRQIIYLLLIGQITKKKQMSRIIFVCGKIVLARQAFYWSACGSRRCSGRQRRHGLSQTFTEHLIPFFCIFLRMNNENTAIPKVNKANQGDFRINNGQTGLTVGEEDENPQLLSAFIITTGGWCFRSNRCQV
jgi:hypothetical protein